MPRGEQRKRVWERDRDTQRVFVFRRERERERSLRESKANNVFFFRLYLYFSLVLLFVFFRFARVTGPAPRHLRVSQSSKGKPNKMRAENRRARSVVRARFRVASLSSSLSPSSCFLCLFHLRSLLLLLLLSSRF